jgi:hypothetical protein
MTDVLQCPHCVLRFSTQSELDQHKAFDHPDIVAEEPAPEEAAPAAPEAEPAQEQRPEPEPEQKGGWFKRLFGGS